MPRLKPSQSKLDQVITLRVDAGTRANWQAQAQAAGLPLGDWLREQVASGTGRRTLPRRNPPLLVDPKLLGAIERIANNLNRLAWAANRQQWPGEIDLLPCLIDIERALRNLVPSHDCPNATARAISW